MPRPHIARLFAYVLFGLAPVAACAQSGAPAAQLSADDLESVGERIRQTGAQLKADLKEARARLEAKRALEEAERQRAEQALKEKQAQEMASAHAREQAAVRAAQAERERVQAERARRLLAEQAERERVAALAAQKSDPANREEAKRKAADALRKARESVGARAFE
jgi:hypothetical protein